jgi:hypothetical protein
VNRTSSIIKVLKNLYKRNAADGTVTTQQAYKETQGAKRKIAREVFDTLSQQATKY